MIEIRELSKKFGRRAVLDGVSFAARPGELITLLGPNGAGKTTLMRILCGYLAPDAGSVSVGGLSYENNRIEILRQIGYMPENVPLYPEMTVFEYLRFIAGIFKITAADFDQNLACISDALGIEPVLGQKFQTLSKGYKRRAGIAAAMLHQPRLAVLDEPTEGLDPNQKIAVREFLKQYAKENLVLISTHLLEEAEALKSRVLLLAEGKIRLDGPVGELRACSKDGTLADAFARLTADAKAGKEGE